MEKKMYECDACKKLMTPEENVRTFYVKTGKPMCSSGNGYVSEGTNLDFCVECKTLIVYDFIKSFELDYERGKEFINNYKDIKYIPKKSKE